MLGVIKKNIFLQTNMVDPITIPPYIITEISELQKDNFEHNGQILWKDNELVYNHQKGQTMDDCKTCEINWHTHPSDYVNLYPDHPSAIDMKYIYKVTCKEATVGTHIVFTPKYIYAIRYNCKNAIREVIDFLTIQTRIDTTFNALAKKCDRGSEEFRDKWINSLRRMGYTIDIFSYDDSIVVKRKSPYNPSIPWPVLLIPLLYFVSKTFV